jgi:hypothetical protein
MNFQGLGHDYARKNRMSCHLVSTLLLLFLLLALIFQLGFVCVRETEEEEKNASFR